MEVDNQTASAHTGDPIYAGEDLIGVVTSGAYGHHIGTNIAMGYVEPSWTEPGTELSVEVIGQRCRATVRAEPMFDPEHRRPRINVADAGL
jgi:dimethylglycine dehydrogenase